MELAKEHFELFHSVLPLKASNVKTTARQKLVKLNKNQFGELSTDVYDELKRRKADVEPFLLPNQSYHPKRNQARQKLATLPMSRFEDLMGDVYHEIVARFPEMAKQTLGLGKGRRPSLNGVNAVGPPANGSRSRKSSLTFSSSGKHSSNAPVNFASLDTLMADLGGLMNDQESGIDLQNGHAARAIEDEEMALKLRDREQTIFNLKQDMQVLRSNLASEVEALTTQLITLRADFKAQENMTNEFRDEASGLLHEMKTLGEENAELRTERQDLKANVAGLRDECDEWRDKYSRAMIRVAELEKEMSVASVAMSKQLSNASPMSASHSAKGAAGNLSPRDKDRLFSPKSGSDSRAGSPGANSRPLSQASIIKRVNTKRRNPNIDFEADNVGGNMALPIESMEQYYIAVNQILSESRAQEEPNTNILVAMKSIVIACKNLTQNSQRFEEGPTVDSRTLATLGLIKMDMSQILTYQMALAKKFAVEPDNDVREDIEVALKSLTSVVLDLYYTVDDHLIQGDDNNYNESPNSNEKESQMEEETEREKYEGDSPVKTEKDVTRDGEYPKPQSNQQEMARVKTVLELETDKLVKSIQILLQLLKSSQLAVPELDDAISNISDIVLSLVHISQTAGIECRQIVDMLEMNRQGLFGLVSNLKRDGENKGLKQQIASSSYEIAKFVKQLIETI